MLNDESKLYVFGPGYGDPSDVINILVSKFHKELSRETVVLNYRNRGVSDTIDQIAKEQLPVLKAARHEFEEIVFIGHSLGGLVGRELLKQYSGLFDYYISLATPHRGTALASGRLAKAFATRFSPSARQLAYNGEYIEELPLPTCPSLTFQASFDPLLWPQDSAQLPEVENVIVPWSEHIRVATSDYTFKEIVAWLEFQYCPSKVTTSDFEKK